MKPKKDEKNIIEDWHLKTIEEKIKHLNDIIDTYPDIPEKESIIKQRQKYESIRQVRE